MAERHCRGCGQANERCNGSCDRSDGPARFCPRCGRRLVDMAVTPALVEARCRDHGRP